MGFTCPHAVACKTYVPPSILSPLTPGTNQYICAFAVNELNVKTSRVVWSNLRLLLEADDHLALLRKSVEQVPDQNIVRLHQWGDFYSEAYLQAWFRLMRETPRMFFEVCTKALPWLLKELQDNGAPLNATISVSSGGTHDSLLPTLRDLSCNTRHVAYTLESLNDQRSSFLTDLSQLSPLEDATFVLQGMQKENTPSGELAADLGSGELFAETRKALFD
jgi:hypothetical protein